MRCTSCAGRAGGVICKLIYKQNHLYISISTANRFFTTVTSSLNILVQYYTEKQSWSFSTAVVFQAARSYSSSPQCHTQAVYPMSSLTVFVTHFAHLGILVYYSYFTQTLCLVCINLPFRRFSVNLDHSAPHWVTAVESLAWWLWQGTICVQQKWAPREDSIPCSAVELFCDIWQVTFLVFLWWNPSI